MKKFKSLFLAAAIAFGFAACNNDENYYIVEEGSTYMTISLGGVVSTRNAGTGALEAPGVETAGTIQLGHAQVFVINSAGAVTHSQSIPTSGVTILTVDGSPTGNNLTVQLTNRIFVVGNTPTAQRGALAGLNTLQEILDFTSAIATQADYTGVVLSNVNAAPVAVSSGTAVSAPIPGNNPAAEMREVTVRINPVISRLELHDVNAVAGYRPTTLEITRTVYDPGTSTTTTTTAVETIQARITAFTVTGVFLDNTFGNFTYAGGGTGLRELGTMTNDQLVAALAAGNVPYYILGTWTGTAATAADVAIARPLNDQVWAFNVASSNVPRLIVRFENLTWMPAAADDWRPAGERDPIVVAGGPRFITVTGYEGINAFTRGNIYRIGSAVDGSDGFGLTVNDILDMPIVINPQGVNVRVGIAVQEWRWFPTTPIWR